MNVSQEKMELINSINLSGKTVSEIAKEYKALGLGLTDLESILVDNILIESKDILDYLKDK
ncbi:MAG: hypothetical protein LBO66_08430 [Deltaproteobacteria bacterium]|nr:hypothetical protein [Deltaproteobacteria bacterium]